MSDFKNKNFWKLHPELAILFPIYEKDKSKGKEETSTIMWAIHLCEALDSKFYNLPNKYTLISDKFLGDKKFKWIKYKDVIETYKEVVLNDAERSLTLWNETMRIRSRAIKEMFQAAINESDTDELVKLDKMLSTTPKMFDDYKKIRKDYEESKITKKGKSINSMSDSDEI